MQSVRGFCFVIGTLLACSVQADTIPTLTATSASLDWNDADDTGRVSGPGLTLYSLGTYLSSGYPCSAPVPAGGCVAPGPTIYLQHYPPDVGEGYVTLGGTTHYVYFEGNAQIQYLTPTIVYPEPPPSGSALNHVDVPVLLVGSEQACLAPPGPPTGNPCVGFDSYGMPLPGYPDYLANISINVPGTLTIYVDFGPDGRGSFEYISFTSVPELGSVTLACFGLSVLAAAAYRRKTKFFLTA